MMNNQKTNTKPVEKTVFPDVMPKTPQHIAKAVEDIKAMRVGYLAFAYNDSFYLEATQGEVEGEILIRMVPTLENPLRAIYNKSPMIQMFQGKFFMAQNRLECYDFLEKCMGCIVRLFGFLKTHERATQNRACSRK